MIIRTNKRDNLAFFDKTVLWDDSLSWKAKGIAAYLLAHSNGWEVKIADLIGRSTDGGHAVRSGMKELIDAGYVDRQCKRDEHGVIKEWIYTLHEIPPGITPDSENQEVDEPDRDYPDVDYPDVENRDPYKELRSKELDVPLVEEEKISAYADPTPQPEETEPEKPAIITDIQTFEEKEPDIESGGRAPSEWQEQVGALCWVCYGHQDVSLLMKEQRGQLLREAKVIFKEKGYTVGELRTWYKSEWRKRDWRGKKGDRPQPSWVRSGIATVRAQPDETTSIWDRMDLMADRILGLAA